MPLPSLFLVTTSTTLTVALVVAGVLLWKTEKPEHKIEWFFASLYLAATAAAVVITEIIWVRTLT